MEDLPPLDWDALEDKLASVLTQAAFDQRTIDNTHDLLSKLRVDCALPSGVAKGYWDTISLSWPDWEVEVFPDHFELYHFQSKGMDISEFMRNPGEPIPETLADQLPRQGADLSN